MRSRMYLILSLMFLLTSCSWFQSKAIVKGPDRVKWQIEYKNGSKVEFAKNGENVTIVIDDRKPDNVFKSFLQWTLLNASNTDVQIGD